MKKIFLALIALVGTMSMNAQVVKVMKGGEVVATYTAAQVDSVVFEEEPAGPAYVDLGLSVKWATFNIGASAPEETGLFFAWADTQGYDKTSDHKFTWPNCIYATANGLNFGSATKYNGTDNKSVLDPEDDAAHVIWGNNWRMPTKTEMKELLDNCTWTVATVNGVSGFNVKGTNGNSIFLPLAGNSGNTGGLQDTDCKYNARCYYWASTIDVIGPNMADMLMLTYEDMIPGMGMYMENKIVNNNDRKEGHQIRPVFVGN